MTARAEEGRFTLTDEDGDRLVVRPPGTPPHNIFRFKVVTAAGVNAQVFVTTDEARALRDFLTGVLASDVGGVR